MTRDLAFSPNKHEHARRAVARYAESTLCAFLQGQERPYAVEDVIREITANFGIGAAWPVALIRQALLTEDEDRRGALVTEALEKLTAQIAPLTGV